MNALVQEWIEKAEGDFRTAQREARVRKQPNHEAVCFHSQQCAEKYLKAYLQEQQIYFPKNSQPHQAARAWFAKRRLARMAARLI